MTCIHVRRHTHTHTYTRTHTHTYAHRGVLLHGVPGSGKTAAVRALAGECARNAPQPVALFVRKGADCLGKYAGDAERTLRLLFDEVCVCLCAKLRACFCV
jgi:SpoVK/Ycf46/Vps4 family AAA+-type ATPase